MLKIKNVNLMACCLVALFSFHSVVHAQMSEFRDGTVIKGFGKSAPVPSHFLPENSEFNITFDVASTSGEGVVNRKFDSLARFINMHAAAGVKKENIHLALVVHGSAVFDLLNDVSYQEKFDTPNPNEPLLKALLENNVRVILCGQSAASKAVKSGQLVEGVEIQLSAMTAHALLQQEGYTVNPF
ncbi:DsrE family protein [Alteromonas sp. MB-3u-76]|uniref:DsrE family protein n=1 Tax=Alteromonas sp. MB-3u-76 TaxID=2058133 RepID=UPI001E4FFED4|nr:DsrE family protein [Alteromonas sp. MB-3u-76]